MSKQNVKVEFNPEFVGTLISDRGEVKIGAQEGGMSPYNLLLGGLASCLYATFLEISEKKKITFESASFDIEGDKRETVPTTLEKVVIKLTVKGASDEKGLVKSLDLAAKYCSIYQTLSHVAEMHHEIIFE